MFHFDDRVTETGRARICLNVLASHHTEDGASSEIITYNNTTNNNNNTQMDVNKLLLVMSCLILNYVEICLFNVRNSLVYYTLTAILIGLGTGFKLVTAFVSVHVFMASVLF